MRPFLAGRSGFRPAHRPAAIMTERQPATNFINLVHIDAPCIRIQILVVHGLDKSYGENAVDAFWLNSTVVARKHRCIGVPVLCFVDAKCRLTDDIDPGPCVGTLLDPAWRRTFVTSAFLKFCEEFGLVVASTFSEERCR